MQDRLNRVIDQIPDEIGFIKPAIDAPNDSTSGPFGRDPQTLIRTLRKWIGLSPFLALSLLVLLSMLRVRSLKDLLNWWGIPLFSAGLLILSIGIAAGPLLDWAWVHYAMPQFPSMISSGLAELGQDVLRSVVHELRKWLILEASLIALLGLGAIIASFYVVPPAQAAGDGGASHE